jgi:integrase
VFAAHSGTKIRKTFPSLATAKAWRAEALAGLRKGTVRAARPVKIGDAAEDLLGGMQTGRVRTRSGDVYKPSSIRSYESVLRRYLLPQFGALKLTDLQRRDVQRLADELLAGGKDASTIRNVLMPLRVIYRRAIEDGDAAVNPCDHLRLPAVRGRRDRIVPPETAAALLAALEPRDLWALALCRSASGRAHGPALYGRKPCGRRNPCGAIVGSRARDDS